MEDPNNPRILKEDVIRREGFKANSHYDPVHLLQWAHNANLQMSMEFKARRREWEAVLQDGKDGKEAKFEVRTPWSDPEDCMDCLIATIYYDPNDTESKFFITEKFYAVSLAGPCVIESPLFHCASEEELIAYLADKETPFKRYLHLEHIMEEMQQSERGREYVHLLEQQQKEKDQKKDSD